MKLLRENSLNFQSWPAGVRWVIAVVVWLGLTICFYQPAGQVLDGGLDASIFTAYAYFLAHGFQFGPEALAMGGPYAFIMYGGCYGGDLFWLRVAGELMLQGIFSALLLWFFLKQSPRSWIRWLWIPLQLMFSTELADLTVAWTMLLAGFLLLEKQRDDESKVWPILATVLLSWLAFFKGTHLVLSFATIGVVTFAWVILHKWRHAFLLLGTYLAGLLGWWLLARQNPLNLPSYITGTLHLASAYNGAMSLEEPMYIFRRGVAVAGGFAVLLGITAWIRRREPLQVAGLVLLAGNTLVMWKHGFVRADIHVVFFFCFAAVAVPAWYLHFVTREGRPALAPWLGAIVATVVLLLISLAGRADPLRPPLDVLTRYFWSRLGDHTHYLSHLSTERAALETRLQSQREFNLLPNTQRAIGRSTVDCYGNQQGILPLNGLNYRPRPMGAGTFAVCDSYLLGINRDFMRDPLRRPDFFLYESGSIDNRFVTQDDGLTLQELIHGYRPESIEGDFLLMRAIPGARAPEARPVSQQTFKFGESIKVPAVKPDEILLTRFLINNSGWGKMRSLLYKPPQVFITLRDTRGAELGIRRLVPDMAASPFIFSPWIEHTEDLLGIYDAQRGIELGSFVISSPGPQFYADALTVEFTALPRPHALDPLLLGALRTHHRFPFTNIIPESITPAFKQHPAVRYVHAPSEIVWPLTGAERQLNFQYGLDPKTYEDGSTNGVEFIAEIRGPSGGVTRAFSRLLQPLSIVADRGRQIATITLPIYAPGSRLVLRTDPGPYGDTAWDWAYVAQVEIQPGRYAAAQFPGFDRVPDRAEGENAAAIEVDGKKILMLNVPGSLHFNLTGNEKQVVMDFGFLPGAYSNGGQTPGGDYVLELQHANQPSRELFRRTLRPLTVPADRGRQSAQIPLPTDVRVDDVLTLRTATLPNATNSWGWTYVERLTIK